MHVGVSPKENLAFTAWFDPITTTHPPVPEQDPDQPAKIELLAGVAANVTTVPAGYVRPDGFAVTVPLPVPDFVTVSLNVAPLGGNRAFAILSAVVRVDALSGLLITGTRISSPLGVCTS